MFRDSSLFDVVVKINEIVKRVWIFQNAVFSLIETWSHSVSWKIGYEFYYRQKGYSMIFLATVEKD
jgi:hypothetical protein